MPWLVPLPQMDYLERAEKHCEMKRTNAQKSLDRRQFLKLSGGLTFLVAVQQVLPGCAFSEEQARDIKTAELSAWVHLQSDGTVTIFNPAAEMGQGSMTGLAVIVAEEMDADWEKVRIEQSPVEPDTYGLGWGGELGGPMLTVGSRTIRGYYRPLRHAGAQVRFALRRAAAEHWEVPIGRVDTIPGQVVDAESGRKLSYGDIAALASELAPIPEIPEEEWKDPSKFRLIGKKLPRRDTPAKVDGSARFALDVQLPGMVYGVVSRSPVHGRKPQLENETAIRALPGVLDVLALEHGIGVIAKSTAQALKAKRALQISWTGEVTAASHNSQSAFDQYAQAFDQNRRGESLTDEGDVERAYRGAAKRYTADYKNDYVYHAQMEPLNAVVSVAEDGRSAEVWAGSQALDSARRAAAEALGLPLEQVKFQACYLGGGFGRRSLTGYVTEAALLAQAAKKPLKLVWTREDDVQYGAFRPISLQRMQAGVDSRGQIVSWSHRIMGPGDNLIASGARNPFYHFPNQRIERYGVEHGIRTKHWRSVGHGPNKFAIEAFIDEIATDQGADPVAFRLRHMEGHPRARAVLQAVADMADWGAKPPEGRARGVVCSEHGGSYAAGICEISLDRARNQIRVHRFWAALDPGTVIQPDSAIAQMEGGILMGISSVLKESITFDKGAVQQSNFNDYPILGMAEVPESIEVRLLPSGDAPGGIGESGTPLAGGAIANAFAALTGQRLRHLPFTPEKVAAAINRPVSAI